jgi:hypothetical protein
MYLFIYLFVVDLSMQSVVHIIPRQMTGRLIYIDMEGSGRGLV